MSFIGSKNDGPSRGREVVFRFYHVGFRQFPYSCATVWIFWVLLCKPMRLVWREGFKGDELSLLAWWSCFVTVEWFFVAFPRIPWRQDQLDPFFAFMSGQRLKRNFVDFLGGEYGPRSDAKAATTWRTKSKDVLLLFIWLLGLVTKYLISLPICISKLPRVVNNNIRIPEVQRTTVNKSILCNNLPVPMLGCSNQLGLFQHFASAVWG